MPQYAILMNPGHNRVYFEQSMRLGAHELAMAAPALSAEPTNIRLEELGRVPYMMLDGPQEWTPQDMRLLCGLSFAYAIYKVEHGRLSPMDMDDGAYLDNDIASMLKYTGKTNEIFTKMLLNAAIFAGDFAHLHRLRVLDPIAGRGTTLFCAARYGHDAFGVELHGKSTQEAALFFKRYLEKGHIKHSHRVDNLNAKDPRKHSVYRFAYARDKLQFRDDPLELDIVCGDSRYTDQYFKRHSMHAIAGDLPYGVAHAAHAGERMDSFTRNPKELLEECLDAWVAALKPGGAMALSWNSFVLARDDMIALLERHGLTVPRGPAYDDLAHMVNQSIRRDLIIGRKNA